LCIARARRLLREDAWNSAGATLLIAAYLQRGNRRAARQHYERFVQLHGEPSPELLDLARAHWL
jgi:DNA-binding SARP family transcriptional activator